ncbi:MAG: hypothetical protein JJU35_05480 [Balneolales bacterium]|nr:hypothetical protein [Balneolales bacterium]
MIHFLTKSGFIAALAITIMLHLPGDASARQFETVSVQIVGLQGVLNAPFVNDIENNYNTGQYLVNITYEGSDIEREFIFDLELTLNGQRILNISSDPYMIQPGFSSYFDFFDNVSFDIDFDDIVESLPRRVRDQLIQSGALPEGNYQLRIAPRPVQMQPAVSVNAIPAVFVVRFPQPPVLITPPNNVDLPMSIPLFSWSPVVVPGDVTVEYEFVMVELFEGQNPGDALLSNRTHHREILIQNTTFPYTPDLNPLEEGKTYAWQVTASDVNGVYPFAQDGESEIYTFSYRRGDDSDGSLPDLEKITLIPMFAELSDLKGLEVDESPTFYTFNGRAVVGFTLDDGREATVEAIVQNLTILKSNMNNPVVTGGRVTVAAEATQSLFANQLPDFINFESVEWELGSGFTASASLVLPFGGISSAEGRLQISRSGIGGFVQVSGSPLVAFQEELVEAYLNSIRVDFPQAQMNATGDIRFLGRESGCQLTNFETIDTAVTASFLCPDRFQLPLLEGSALISAEVQQVSGSVLLDVEDGSMDYDLSLNSTIGLLTLDGSYCGSGVNINLDSEEGMSLQLTSPSCNVANPKIDLGFARLAFSNTSITQLEYRPDSGDWDFELMLDARLDVPAFGSWQSAIIRELTVNRDGIRFAALDFGDGVNPLPEFDLEMLRVSLDRFEIEEFTFPLFNWDGDGPGPWALAFEGRASIREIQNLPYCLLGTTLAVTNGRAETNMVRADLGLDDFEGCEWQPGPFVTINLDGMAGSAGVRFLPDDGIEPFGALQIDGGISFDGPFSCDSNNAITFSGEDLLLSDGINGVLDEIVPNCEVELGPFTAQMNTSKITFIKDPGAPQQAVLEAAANLGLPDGGTASGSFSADLIAGTFSDISFEIEGPFDWNIPNDTDPVLTFRLDAAHLSSEGFRVNGRQGFRLGDEMRQVTFDNLLLDFETWRIREGQIIFDETFAFEIGIGTDLSGLAFAAIPPDQPLLLETGLKMQLGATVIADSSGLRTSGIAGASLSFDGTQFDEVLTVEFSEDFAIGLYPVRVSSGEAQFFYEGSRIAWVDEGGFHPDWGFFADHLIPERLPLPSEDIAYIQLRDEDNYFVNVSQNDDGHIVLTSLAGTPLQLVVPYLDAANPPVLTEVSFENFTLSLNPSNPEVVSGSIVAEIPEGLSFPGLQNRNIPLSLKTVRFGLEQTPSGAVTALFLAGNLNLFDQILEGTQEVSFYLQGDGFVRANVQATGMNANLALFNDRVKLGVDEISGMFAMPVNSTSPDYNFSVTGDVEVLTDQGYRAGAGLTLTTATGGYFGISAFESYAIDESPLISIGDFGLEFDGIANIPEFSYDNTTGLTFAIAIDAGLRIPLDAGDEIYFPLRGIEIRNNGIRFPTQNINEAEIPGLSLPSFSLADFEFTPLALNIPEGFTFSWEDGAAFNIGAINMDFRLNLPDFLSNTSLNPPDGLLFTGVGYQNGMLTGELDIFYPNGGALVPLGSGADAPQLVVEEISGALRIVEGNSFTQVAEVFMAGRLDQLPVFSGENSADCPDGPGFTLALTGGNALEGTISGVQPCGSLPLGPISLQVTEADLYVFAGAESQVAELDGAVTAELPGPQEGSTISVTGALSLNLLTGEISGGSIAINEPFELPVPWNRDDPLFNLSINQALLNEEGITLSGSGSLLRDELDAELNFNDLQIALSEFEILGGSAELTGGLTLDIGLNPLSLSLMAPGSPLPDTNLLRINTQASVSIGANGLGFDGAADALLQYEGESYSNLRVVVEDNFAMSITGFAVTAGRALFYWDQDGVPAQEPIAVLDVNGFTLGSGLIALLPDRIPLPSEDIAYIDIKDDDGNTLITVDELDSGYQLSTGGASLPLVIPALTASDGDTLVVMVSFSITTDNTWNVTGGSLSLDTEQRLEDRLNLPVRLALLEIDVTDGVSLTAGLAFDLPAIFEGSEAMLMATLTKSGIKAATFTAGDHRTEYNPNDVPEPLYTFSHTGNVDDAQAEDSFTASLLGIEAAFGESNSVAFSATLFSSLLMEAGDAPVFFMAAWGSEGWNINADPGSLLQDMRFGSTVISLDEHEPVRVQYDEDAFILSLNGSVSFEEVLKDPVLVTIKDLEVGVKNIGPNPQLHLALGEATGELGEQSFELFEGALSITMTGPAIVLSGRQITISSDGKMGFLDQEIEFQGLSLSTDGGFSINQISAEDVPIIPDYVMLKSVVLEVEDGLRLNTQLAFLLPEPLSDYVEDTGILLEIYRDNDGNISTNSSGLVLTPSGDNGTFDLGDFGEISLTQVRIALDPFNPTEPGLFANAVVRIPDEQGDGMKDVINFGRDIVAEPGIGIARNAAGGVDLFYNVTGSYAFERDFSFFRVAIMADMAASDTQAFEIQLAGRANINLERVEADLGYTGIVIGTEGVRDWGNIDRSGGTIDIADMFALTVGSFMHHRNENGFDMTVANTDAKDPKELENEPTRTIPGVTEVFCFGTCNIDGNQGSDLPAVSVSISGAESNSDAGFSGGVDKIFFYQTLSGNRSITIENLHASIDTFFSMQAHFNYVQEDGNVLIRAAAAGSFTAGGQSVSAVVAGLFSNLNNELRYGLFVAAQSDAGIPIIPGVLNLTGAGGGFFYRPNTDDLAMVYGGIAAMGHELVNEDAATIKGDTGFAVMLYAGVGFGPPGAYILEGTTFLQITNNAFYIDSRAYILEMDSEKFDTIANMDARASLYASVNRANDGSVSAINIGIDVNVEVPAVLTGSGEIEYFYVNQGDGNPVWGIIGNADFTAYSILTGRGELLIGPPGFLVVVGLGIDVPVPVIQVNGDIEASIWLMTSGSYSMPFGAYAEFEASACLAIFCATATAKGAFVTRNPSGYELFAAVEACAGSGDNRCLAAWASVYDGNFTAGLGSSGNNDLIAQARDQKQQFEDEINNLVAAIDNAMNEVELTPIDELFPSEDSYRLAGFNLYSMSYDDRDNWVNLIQGFESNHLTGGNPYNLPPALNDLLNQVVRTNPGFINPMWSITSNRSALEKFYEVDVQDFNAMRNQISSDLGVAIELLEDAELQFEQMSQQFLQSPVGSIQRVRPSQNATSSVSFAVDDDVAADQASAATNLRSDLSQLESAFRESISSVAANLEAMNDLLHFGTEYPQSLNSLMGSYSTLINNFERYYASHSHYRWTNMEWAQALRNDINSRSGAISSAIAALNNGYATAMGNPGNANVNLNNEAMRIARRVQAVNLIEDNVTNLSNMPAIANSSAGEIYDQLSVTTGVSATQRAQLINGHNTGFWLDMHQLGLERYYQNQFTNLVENVVLSVEADRENIFAPARQLTEVMERFYGIKSNMTSLLWNLTDNYVEWRQAAEGEGGATAFTDAPPLQEFEDQLQQLSNQLMPPVITSMVVNPQRGHNHYFNQTHIQWTATHPVEVVENAVTYNYTWQSGSTNIEVGIDDYISIGNNSSLRLYPGRIVLNDRNVNVGIRVRGPAGNTAFRRASFKVDVGPGGETTPGGTEVLPDVTNPPDMPHLILAETFNFSEDSGQRTYWTNQGGPLPIVINGYDAEVGIASYEYAIGTTSGGTDVSDWRVLQGERQFLAGIPAQQIRGTTVFLNLEEGVPYYFSVRVTNTMGQVSPAREHPDPLQLDQSEPGLPELQHIGQHTIQPPSQWPVGVPAVTAVPPLEQNQGHLANPIRAVYGNPTLRFNNLQAEDSQSGIAGYEYLLSRDESVPGNRFAGGEAVFHEAQQSTMEITGGTDDPVFDNFTREVWLHIRAVDRAGNRGEIATFGPFTSVDHTLPVAGRLPARLEPDNIRLYITHVPYDPESDITGIQYSVIWYDGGQPITVRAFPPAGEVDFVWNLQQTTRLLQGGHNAPNRYFDIPRAGLPVGENLYVQYRSVNTKGLTSAIHETGPINLDTTIPLMPQVSVSFNTQTRRFTINADNIEDPESGILTVHYSVSGFPANPFNQHISSTPMHTHQQGVRHGSFNLQAESPALADDLDPVGLRVRIVIKNGAGLTRVITRAVTESHLFTPITFPGQVIPDLNLGIPW